MSHPDNEIDSEFSDRISDLEEIENYLSKDKWIKIESEDDLPKEENGYWVIGNNGLDGIMHFEKSFNWLKEWKEVTHYQPVIRPKPPIY